MVLDKTNKNIGFFINLIKFYEDMKKNKTKNYKL